jgi:hypothetical protein
MTRTRYITASFTAPLAALLIPSILALSQLYADSDLMPDGSYDDAGIRSAGLFLLVVAPVLYVVACMYYAVVGHLLARANRLTRRATVSLAAAAPWSLVALASVGLATNNRSILPGLTILAVIGLAMSLFAALGASVWWFIAVGSSANSGA